MLEDSLVAKADRLLQRVTRYHACKFTIFGNKRVLQS